MQGSIALPFQVISNWLLMQITKEVMRWLFKVRNQQLDDFRRGIPIVLVGSEFDGTLKDQFGFAHSDSSVILCKALVGARIPQRHPGEFKSSVWEHGDPVTWHQTSRSHPVKGNTSLAVITLAPPQANVDGGLRLQCFQFETKCFSE